MREVTTKSSAAAQVRPSALGRQLGTTTTLDHEAPAAFDRPVRSEPTTASASVGAASHRLALPPAIPTLTTAPIRPQFKLKVNTPGDQYEQEADRVADMAMRMPEPAVQRKCTSEAENSDCGGFTFGGTEAAREPARLRRKESGPGLPEAPAIVHRALSSSGRPLDDALRLNVMEPVMGRDLSGVRIHTGSLAAEAAEAVDAKAYTVGQDIVFGAGSYEPGSSAGRRLIAHELAHTLQQSPAAESLHGSTKGPTQSHEAMAGADSSTAQLSTAASPAVMRTPVEKVLKFSAKWLSKRTMKTVSKHIQKHTRMIAGKALHTVFKGANGKEIKSLIESAVRDATELAAKHSKAPASQVLEEGGVKIARQYRGVPGKHRWIVQKTFPRVIGTRGERVLLVVIEQSGRIVTAFPAERLTAIGLTAAGIEMFSERTADAATSAREQVESSAKAAAERESAFTWEEFIPIFGDLWGGSLNEGEDEMLRLDRHVEGLIETVIHDVEETELRSLGPKERQELEELVRAAITAPLAAETSGEEDS